MNRKRYQKLIPIIATYAVFCLLFFVFYHPSWAAPLAQTTQQDDGQEYVVQPGDSLYKISGQFYGQPGAFPVIVEATNAKAATDPRFRRIVDPRRIQAGQRLWIPDSAELPIINGANAAADEPTIQPITATDAATPSERSVRFLSPANGATVPPSVTVEMSATGLTVEPAGEIREGAGHFHILIDTDFVPAGEVIIADEQHRHFGKAQLTTTLGLDPGEHVLRLQFADGAHIALEGPAYQDTITVTAGATETTATDDNSGPSVRFVEPRTGATVPPSVTVEMTATGLIVEPAGEIHEGAGHFHILIDTDFVPTGEVIITDDQHRHFGKAQVTTTLGLDPGEHVLRLQFANGAHIALEGPAYQDTITVTVAATATTTDDSSAGPSVRFVTPLNEATVPPSVTVEMSATGLMVEPAGEISEGAGHFHILIDTDFVPAGEVIITDDQHRHFGKAQVTTTLGLDPGEHVLRLQFANGAHIALEGPAYQDTITVTVAETATTTDDSSAGPSVRFVEPLDGETVSPTVAVAMTATGLTVEPAGEIQEGAGHFHILVDTDFVEAGEVIINDEQHLHFGKAQLTTTLELEPGEHILRLQFADGAHIALEGDAYRDEITVRVE